MGRLSLSQTVFNKKRKDGKCITPYCRNQAGSYRTKCDRCRKREWAAKYPIKYRFANLRTNAKKRNKPFSLKFNEFYDFCQKTGYHLLSGKAANSMTIDRIDNTIGYQIGNLQMISLSENTIKRNTTDVPF